MGGLPMNRRKFISDLAWGTSGLALGAVASGLRAGSNLTTLTILHTNDLHSHIEPFNIPDPRYNGKGGLARISAMVKHFKKENPNSLLLDAGDMFQGTPYFNFHKGEMKTMSAAGYDAGTIGNHEFDNGLKGILDPLPHARFPIINSNYDFSDTILNGKFPKWKIFNKSGIKIGVYGLGIELHRKVLEKNYGNTLYKDPVATALEMEILLREEMKCDLVVCLSHLGLKYSYKKINDLALAEETRSTDLIIGGHTHTYLEKPIIKKNKAGKKIIVNQAWWGGMVMGKIDFVFEPGEKRPLAYYSANI